MEWARFRVPAQPAVALLSSLGRSSSQAEERHYEVVKPGRGHSLLVSCIFTINHHDCNNSLLFPGRLAGSTRSEVDRDGLVTGR